MGFLSSEMMYDEFSMDDVGMDMFKELLDGRYSPVMKYIVVRDIPVWYTQIHGSL
jgi:hypothetical protein